MTDETKNNKTASTPSKSEDASKTAAKKPQKLSKKPVVPAKRSTDSTKATTNKTPARKAVKKAEPVATNKNSQNKAKQSKPISTKSTLKDLNIKSEEISMTANTNQKNTTQTPQEAVVAPAAIAPAAPVVVKSGSGVALMSMLLSLGALGLSGYLYYTALNEKAAGDVSSAVGIAEVKKDVSRIDGDIKGIETNLNTLKAGVTEIQTGDSQYVTLAALKQSVDAGLDKTITEKINPVLERQKTLNDGFAKIKAEIESQDSTYALSKSRKLIDSAQYQLDQQGDVDGALKLLKLASTQIKSLKSASLNTARKKVLAHINALEAIETPDLTAISSKLTGLSKDLVNWPLQNEPKAEVITKAEAEPKEAVKVGFLGEVKAVAKEAFNDTFKVQKVGAKPKVLLAPTERYFLNQNLQLQLLTAQNAMLQGEQAIYSNNVKGAREWIAEYFDANDARVSSSLEDLTAIESVVLKPALPDISDVLGAFERGSQTVEIAKPVAALITAQAPVRVAAPVKITPAPTPVIAKPAPTTPTVTAPVSTGKTEL